MVTRSHVKTGRGMGREKVDMVRRVTEKREVMERDTEVTMPATVQLIQTSPNQRDLVMVRAFPNLVHRLFVEFSTFVC